MNTILRLKYKREYFDLMQMKIGAKEVITISDDGTIISKDYQSGSRKAHSVRKVRCPLASYEKLCKEIESCIENADRQDFYVDDSSEELKIVHKYGRVQIMDRGLGSEDVHIGDVMNEFLAKYIDENKIWS